MGKKQQCVLIAGMHRCGTSALAGVLAHSGVDFGNNLLASQKGENELGFYEDVDVLSLNDRFLHDVNSSWDDTRPLQLNLHKNRLLEYKKDLAELIEGKFSKSKIFGIKDPRISILLDIWINVIESLDIEYKVIILFRHPDEIANSLRKRNGFSFVRSAYLISNYFTHVISFSDQSPRLFVNYKSILSKDNNTVYNLADFTGLDEKEIKKACDEYLEVSLRNQKVSKENAFRTFNNQSESMIRLYNLLQDMEVDDRAIDERIEFNLSTSLDMPIEDLSNEIMITRSELRSVVDRFNTFTGISGELNKTNERIRELKLLVEKLENDLHSSISTQKRYFDDELKKLVEDNNNQQCELQKLSGNIYENFDELSNRLQERTDWIKVIDQELHNNRELLVKIANRKHFSNIIKPHVKLMIRQGIKYPHKILPWILRRVKNHLLRLRLKKDGDLKKILAPQGDVSEKIKNLAFSPYQEPKISVVIPVYNDIKYTVGCLQSLSELHDNSTFEVIIIDDASPDVDTSCLSKIHNITWVRNSENIGFIKSCNRGAEYANGKYLLLLNNDTDVQQGCLDALCETFEGFSDAGMVGGKLIYPDGRLQEAGGIVWKDGSAWNWGRLNNPERPEFNYTRKVDYCSGALLMIPLKLYRSLDGFDEHFCPAYYEDTDLAFRVREKGYNVYYQPKAAITHFEGISNGTDLTSGIKHFQVINHEKFFLRWKDKLLSHRNNAEKPEYECDRYIDKRILIIDHRMLTPDQDSGSLRMFNMFRVLIGMGHKVTFLPDNLYGEEPYASRLQSIGVEVITSQFYASVREYLKSCGYVFDIVVLSRLFVAAKNIDTVRKYCTNASVIYDTVDLHFLRELREAELEKDKAKMRVAEDTRNQELSLMYQADATIVVSPYEKELLEKDDPQLKIYTVSNIHEIYGKGKDWSERKDILFIGGFEHPPNEDAVVWFVNEIFPIIQKAIPEIKFHIIGSKPTKTISDLGSGSKNIFVHGFVKDTNEIFNSIRLTIAPLRYGAGVKGKVNQSLAHGVPCVATSIAAEGMGLEHEKNIYVADAADEFAVGVINLYGDVELWNTLSIGGLQNIEDIFSMEAAQLSLLSMIEEVNEK